MLSVTAAGDSGPGGLWDWVDSGIDAFGHVWSQVHPPAGTIYNPQTGTYTPTSQLGLQSSAPLGQLLVIGIGVFLVLKLVR